MNVKIYLHILSTPVDTLIFTLGIYLAAMLR
jgi:hypothetical protein